MRREDVALKTSHVVQFIKEEYEWWCETYLDSNKPESIHRLVRRIVRRNGFSFRQPSRTVLSAEQLIEEQVAYANSVGAAVRATYKRGCILNADETGVYYDDAPGLIIAKRGARGSTKVRGAKISARVTVLLIIAADGSKLPPLIIYLVEALKMSLVATLLELRTRCSEMHGWTTTYGKPP
ncbi:hypothetical protein PINS_up004125 [Pythium insidiosum]|nr:hypothetical protein PINS_up004125 [Pythium insidiosum]